MPAMASLSTRIRPETKRALIDVCARRGLKLTAVVDEALREKLEDLADSAELEDAIRSARQMIPYRAARRVLKRGGVLR